MVSFNDELYAVAAFVMAGALVASVVHSAVVGRRKPGGDGLFVPFTPCHKLLFPGLSQSGVPIKNRFVPGLYVELVLVVVPYNGVPATGPVHVIF